MDLFELNHVDIYVMVWIFSKVKESASFMQPDEEIKT